MILIKGHVLGCGATDLEDELQSLEKQLLRKIYTWMVVGGVAVGGVGGSGMLRVDKFGATDATVMRLEIQRDCKEYIDGRFEAHQKVIPPTWTRARIRHIEDYLGDRDPNFEPAAEDW
jgi:hypothetical protein